MAVRFVPADMEPDPNIYDAMQKVLDNLNAEDIRMRTEVLPDPPQGWEWHVAIEVNDSTGMAHGVLGEVRIALRYELKEVVRRGNAQR